MANIIHLTTVHSRNDIRVFIKQCRSISGNGHNVWLFVADGLGSYCVEGVNIVDVGKPRNRLHRMLLLAWAMVRQAKRKNADVYHLHDPELTPYVWYLRAGGKSSVVFDVHEDIPKQILHKPYLNKTQALIASKMFSWYESLVLSRFDFLISATPAIGKRLLKYGKQVEVVNNYPIIGELSGRWAERQKENKVCYVGGVSEMRGATEMLSAISITKSESRLAIAGAFSTPALENQCRNLKGWDKVDYLGFINRADVGMLLSESCAGLVLFHPLPNHMDAQPNKLFEYMSAGVPVIASNFPLWREVIERWNCGICVDPLKPTDIAEAIDFIVSDPDNSRLMGDRGAQAVISHYNWALEADKLFAVYDSLLK